MWLFLTFPITENIIGNATALPTIKTAYYQQSVVSAVRFVIANRCELDSDMKISGGINLNAADMFKDSRDLIRFCNIVNQSAKDALLEMEREIVNILKQRRERSNDIQIKSDRTVSSRNSVHTEPQRTGTSEKADRQVGQNVAGVGENGVSHRGSDIHNGGSLEHNPEGNRQRSGETLLGAGRTVPTAEPPSDRVQRDTDLPLRKHQQLPLFPKLLKKFLIRAKA